MYRIACQLGKRHWFDKLSETQRNQQTWGCITSWCPQEIQSKLRTQRNDETSAESNSGTLTFYPRQNTEKESLYLSVDIYSTSE